VPAEIWGLLRRAFCRDRLQNENRSQIAARACLCVLPHSRWELPLFSSGPLGHRQTPRSGYRKPAISEGRGQEGSRSPFASTCEWLRLIHDRYPQPLWDPQGSIQRALPRCSFSSFFPASCDPTFEHSLDHLRNHNRRQTSVSKVFRERSLYDCYQQSLTTVVCFDYNRNTSNNGAYVNDYHWIRKRAA